MRQVIATLGMVTVGLSALMTLTILARRAVLDLGVRRDREVRARLKGAAIALAAGENVELPHLDERETVVLTGLLTEVSSVMRGDGRDRIAGCAERLGLIGKELKVLASARRPWRRATAARTLGALCSLSAVPALIDALRDRNRDVRATAASALGALAAADASDGIVEELSHGRIPRAVAVQALLRMGPGAVPALRAGSQEGPEPSRRTCIQLLGHLGDAADGVAVLPRLDDPSPEIRAAAARSLGRLGSSRSMWPLVSALYDPVGYVRGAAAEALGRLGVRPAIGVLARVAERDLSWWAAMSASRAVAAIDARAAFEMGSAQGAPPPLAEVADLVSA